MRMRIVVHGQQAFGKAVLEALLKRGDDEVVAVYAAPGQPDARPDPLAEAALAAGLPLVRPASYHDPAVQDGFRALAPDLQVMAFVTLIVPREFLDIPTFGTIQYHPSLLPRHRGRSAINWPIIQGERETGLSVFWPDGGIDTGDVLLQKRTDISETDTLGSVYFDRLFPMGVAALLEAVDLVAAGEAPRVPQDHSQATYECPCERENARIDWGRPGAQVHDLVRGCDPAPGAWTTFGGQALQVFGATPVPARDPAGIAGAMGEVAEVTDAGLAVVCADGRVRVTRVRPAGGAKLPAGEWAESAGLTAGTRLE
jgi:methionyl-tRNA formyltransferase